MPKLYKPTPAEFYACVEILKNEDSFKLLNRPETIILLPISATALLLYNIPHIKNPHIGTGLQAVLRFDSALFAVLVLTTFVEATGEVKASDEGWVLMLDKRHPTKPCFYSFPMNRTKNFLITLIRYAKAFKNRVDTMPSCPECGHTLTINLVRNGRMHEYTLRCLNKKLKHKKFKFTFVYTGMDPLHQKFLEEKFKRYFDYSQKNLENNIQTTPKRCSKYTRSVEKGLYYDSSAYGNDGITPE